MRRTLMMSAAMLGLLAGGIGAPAFAQTSSTQSPPAPGSSSSMPQPTNSLPVGAATSQTAPGVTMNGTTSQAPTTALTRPAMTPVRPRHLVLRPKPVPVGDSAADTVPSEAGAPPTAVYRGGVGSPLSSQAANLRPGREMGSRLPDPDVATTSPRDYLAAALAALNRGQTGKAQEALERAETRILSRTTDPSRAAEPDQSAMARSIATARLALGNHDVRGAKEAITAAMSERVPGPGPAVSRPAL